MLINGGEGININSNSAHCGKEMGIGDSLELLYERWLDTEG